MSIESRKQELRREIERKAAYLRTLESLPDFDELNQGSIVALTVTCENSRPYPVVGFKAEDEQWYLASSFPMSVGGYTSGGLAEWLMSQGRRLQTATVVGQFTVGDSLTSRLREFTSGEGL